MTMCYNAGEGNRLLPTTGPGEGVRPHEPARGERAPDTKPPPVVMQRQGVLRQAQQVSMVTTGPETRWLGLRSSMVFG